MISNASYYATVDSIVREPLKSVSEFKLPDPEIPAWCTILGYAVPLTHAEL